MLKQEGSPYAIISCTATVAAMRQQHDAVIIVGNPKMTDAEQCRAARLIHHIPTVWIGTPPAGESAAALGLKQFRTEQTGTLLQLALKRHPSHHC